MTYDVGSRDASNGSVRTLASAGMLGGAATALSGVAVEAIVRPRSDVSDEMWSYPWSSEALVPVSLGFAGFHLLVFLGMVAFARSRPAGSSRAARIGARLAMAGTFIFFVAEFATIPFADQRLDQTGPMVVGGAFGLGVTLTAVGLIVAGVATIRAREWDGPARFVPLGAGIWATVMIAISFTSALALGVAIYGLSILVLNLAVYTRSKPVRQASTQSHLSPQAQP